MTSREWQNGFGTGVISGVLFALAVGGAVLAFYFAWTHEPVGMIFTILLALLFCGMGFGVAEDDAKKHEH